MPKHIAIDDFAFKKRHRYGTAIIDADTGKYAAFVDSRDYEPVTEALKAFRGVETVSRDGSGGYRKIIADSFPSAAQVSDRFHLVKNFTDAAYWYFKRVIPHCVVSKRENANILGVSGKATSYERRHLAVYERRLAVFKRIKALQADGKSVAAAARETGFDEECVRRYYKMENLPPHSQIMQERGSKLNPYKEKIVEMVKAGSRTKDIQKTVLETGCKCAPSRIRMYISRVRRDGPDRVLETVYRRDIKKLLYKAPDEIPDEKLREKVLKYVSENPQVSLVIELTKEFKEILKSGKPNKLDAFNAKICSLNIKELTTCVNAFENDIAAVKNAIAFPYSNGIAEGKINKLKTIKRMVYGRAGYELLTARLFLSDHFG